MPKFRIQIPQRVTDAFRNFFQERQRRTHAPTRLVQCEVCLHVDDAHLMRPAAGHTHLCASCHTLLS